MLMNLKNPFLSLVKYAQVPLLYLGKHHKWKGQKSPFSFHLLGLSGWTRGSISLIIRATISWAYASVTDQGDEWGLRTAHVLLARLCTLALGCIHHDWAPLPNLYMNQSVSYTSIHTLDYISARNALTYGEKSPAHNIKKSQFLTKNDL